MTILGPKWTEVAAFVLTLAASERSCSRKSRARADTASEWIRLSG